ncbi:unnamed protein product, partial [Brenthis ino]
MKNVKDNVLQDRLKGTFDTSSSSSDVVSGEDVIVDVSDEDYFAMPQLFGMHGDYIPCLKLRGVYCVGDFELSPVGNDRLFRIMKGLSANWVDSFNHTRLHRAICVSRVCPAPDPLLPPTPEDWFESCVNASMAAYNLTARLYRLDYCNKGQVPAKPLTTNDKAFVFVVVILLALTMFSTYLESNLPEDIKKDYGWILSWSLKSSWESLVAPTPSARGSDLRCLDGLRVCCMLFVVGVHVSYYNMIGYPGDTSFEREHRRPLAMFVVNSTLVVQIFFLMSSFLMAHKLLQDMKQESPVKTFFRSMLNRFIRVSPSYFMVVWFTMTWFEKLDDGPLWPPLVGAEAARCRRTWWRQFTYLDNAISMDGRCLIQSWYLSVDMQFYALSLVLTLALRGSRHALPLLAALFLLAIALNLAQAYAWHLVPTFLLHNYQSIIRIYEDNLSMNALYKSPLGSAVSPLAGLLMAHAQVSGQGGGIKNILLKSKWFRFVSSVVALPAAAVFMALAPAALGAGPPRRAAAAALAALERPVFIVLIAVALFGAINGVDSLWRRALAGGRVAARLTYGAYLVHNCFITAVCATRFTPSHLDYKTVFTETLGVLALSYAAALPLALLVELPVQRLYNEIKNLKKV